MAYPDLSNNRTIALVPRRRRGGPFQPPSWFSIAFVALLAGPLLWLSLVEAPSLRVDVGVWGDQSFLSGVNGMERNEGGDFRWTGGRARLTLPNLSGRYQVLRLHAHGWRPPGMPPPQVQLDVAGRPWGSVQTTRELRTYDILLPRDGAGQEIQVGFDTPAYSTEHDQREIGLALDWVELRAVDAAGPTPWSLGSQALLLGLALLLIWALALPPGWTALSAALCADGLIAANLWQPLRISQPTEAWMVVMAGLLAATWLAAPRLKRALAPWMSPAQANAAWALFIAALALRLLGVTHPLFDMHDLHFHTRWLDDVTRGQLYLYSTPSEFQNRQTFYPPAGYLLLLPPRLLLSSRLALHVGVALLDAVGCLLVLLVARELRLPPLAGLLALALALALPISMTMLWWGFATNALAQPLWLLLAWLLLRIARRPTRPGVAVFASVAAISMLMHVGALALNGATIGLLIALGWRRLPAAGRAALIGGLAAALLFTAPLYFAAVAPSAGQLSGEEVQAPAVSEPDLALRLGLLGRGLLLGFLPLPLALAPLGLERLWAARLAHPLRLPLVGAWLAACLAFAGAYLGLGLVARYLYFAAPLVCLGLGALLGPLWRRGRVMTLALILLVVWSGAALWAAGVLMGIKPSALPLTH